MNAPSSPTAGVINTGGGDSRLRCWLTATTVAMMALMAAASHADDAPTHRQHAAHAHGIGRLNLALEDQALYLELHSPAANIFGFEHAPSSDGEQEKLRTALETLEQGDRLFRFAEAAECRMSRVELDSSLIDAAEAEGHHLHKGPEGDAPDPDEDHHHDGDHADITAEYRFACGRPERIDQLTVGLFEAFPGTERLTVQYIVGGQQGAATLTPANPVLRF
ncbi:MAG: DUF2796 domain-containing protein [Sedimenticolaceae bacterium]